MANYYPIFTNYANPNAHDFFFDSEHGLRYFISFTPAAYLFKMDCAPCKNIFEVSFYPEKKSRVTDLRVNQTITHLIRTFINEHRGPIVYVCDSIDKKDSGRLRLFKRWFRQARTSDFRHECRIIDLKDYTLTVGIITFQWDINADDYLHFIEWVS